MVPKLDEAQLTHWKIVFRHFRLQIHHLDLAIRVANSEFWHSIDILGTCDGLHTRVTDFVDEIELFG